jgi:hypothetical protein
MKILNYLMQEDLQKKILVVGMDETNHCNTNDYPEMCVAVFSQNPRDREIQTFSPRNKDSYWLVDHMKNQRDYRFLLLNQREIYPSRHNNLPVVAKSLILPILEGRSYERLEIHIDGRVTRNDKDLILSSLPEIPGMEVYIEGYVKHFKQSLNPSNRRIAGKLTSKKFRQPIIVKLAHELSRFLFEDPLSLKSLANDPHRVDFL